MARKFFTPIDLNGLELQNFKIQNLASDPTAAGAGHAYYNSASKTFKIYDGSTWQNAGNVATGSGAPASSNPATGAVYFDTANFLIYVGVAGSWVQVDQFGSPVAVGSANGDGTSKQYARADHVHKHTDTEHSGIHLNALATATGNYSMGGNKITSLADPTAAQDAATKAYVDATKQGLDIKDSVRVATTANITLSGLQAIDGVTVVAGDRVLVKDQSTGSQNGIYVAAVGSWARATDADTSAKVTSGLYAFVEEGTANADSGWVLTTNNPITLDTTGLAFAQFSGAGQITAGAGLTKSGNTLDVVGTSGRIVVNADSIDLATVSQSNGSGSAGTVFVSGVTVDSYGRVTGVTTASVQDATTAAKGIASFDSASFAVTTGAVSIKSGGVSNTQLANSSVTVTAGTGLSGGGSVSLGGSVTLSTAQDIRTTASPTFAALTLTSALTVANGGTGATTAVGARSNLGATGKYAANLGAVTANTAVTVTHNLNSTDVIVQVRETAGNTVIDCDITNVDANNISLTFAMSSAANAFRVIVIG